jgi:hypothetical protein
MFSLKIFFFTHDSLYVMIVYKSLFNSVYLNSSKIKKTFAGIQYICPMLSHNWQRRALLNLTFR